MSKNTIVAITLSLIVGGGIGYLIASKGAMDTPSTSSQMTAGSHDMQNQMDGMVSNLKDKKGEDLDLAFLEGMIVHHEGAIEMAKIVLEKTKRPEIKKMAEDIINAQSGEIITMKGWLSQWYGR